MTNHFTEKQAKFHLLFRFASKRKEYFARDTLLLRYPFVIIYVAKRNVSHQRSSKSAHRYALFVDLPLRYCNMMYCLVITVHFAIR